MPTLSKNFVARKYTPTSTLKVFRILECKSCARGIFFVFTLLLYPYLRLTLRSYFLLPILFNVMSFNLSKALPDTIVQRTSMPVKSSPSQLDTAAFQSFTSLDVQLSFDLYYILKYTIFIFVVEIGKSFFDIFNVIWIILHW